MVSESEHRILSGIVQMGGSRGSQIPQLLASKEGRELMRRGLIEAVKPKAPYMPYVFITDAGRNHYRMVV